MSEVQLISYGESRSLASETWFVYQLTSIAYYRRCVEACVAVAELLTPGISRSKTLPELSSDDGAKHIGLARTLQACIGHVERGDYRAMHECLSLNVGIDPRSRTGEYLMRFARQGHYPEDVSGALERLSLHWRLGAECLSNMFSKGKLWRERFDTGCDLRALNRDDGLVGSLAAEEARAIELGALPAPPEHLPNSVDRNLQSQPGEPCPCTGVWVPAQWADDRACDFSLAFCVEGRPMQPAYRIAGLEKKVVREADPEYGLEEFATYDKVTRAEDTTWYFVHKPDTSTDKANNDASNSIRQRCEAGLPCPREGYWFTPAQVGSRRHFKAGEPMPEVGGDYGATIWQWDQTQAP